MLRIEVSIKVSEEQGYASAAIALGEVKTLAEALGFPFTCGYVVPLEGVIIVDSKEMVRFTAWRKR